MAISVVNTPNGWEPLNASCPSHYLLRLVGERWTMPVIAALSGEALRFGDFESQIPGISPKMLTKTLRALQDTGLVQLSQRVYSLTPVGESLLPPLQSLVDWAALHMDEVLAQKPAYKVVKSPVGKIGISASAAGITALTFDATGHDDLVPDSYAAAHVAHAESQLEEYFSAQRQVFDLTLDTAGIIKDIAGNTFRYRSWQVLKDVPFGHTWSYSQLAHAAGSEKAVRAVGTACKQNPWPIIIPCHRITKANGDIGHYIGGSQRKAWLLDFESKHA
ncbi:MAG: methylated-DNA--[protein]-cysteine S-methyltransferase [Corynebacterium sp.]|nr:methylated-DNA--[protein]-cysteine S-methyltransferase [Corynebacterium sp.]